MLLTDLADAARKSGLRVVEIPGWRTNISGGTFDPDGVLCHHTGAFDEIADPRDDRDYARWLAFTGRPPTVPPPLCNLALSAEGVVYVCSSGNANHAGQAKASGPMPAASDGNSLYIGIEAMNNGTQGWESEGRDADGRPVTQRHAYARLCAALCEHYGWPADHVRAHRETSTTGKWDPGLLGMDDFRELVNSYLEDDMAQQDIDEIKGKLDQISDQLSGLRQKEARRFVVQIKEAREQGRTLDEIVAGLEAEAGDDAPRS